MAGITELRETKIYGWAERLLRRENRRLGDAADGGAGEGSVNDGALVYLTALVGLVAALAGRTAAMVLLSSVAG